MLNHQVFKSSIGNVKSLFDNRFDFALKMINFFFNDSSNCKSIKRQELCAFPLTTQNTNIKKNVTLTFD